MIRISDKLDDTSDLEAIRRFGFDIVQMNKNIEEYEPYVSRIEEDDGGITVCVEDRNRMVPAVCLDYYIGPWGDLESEWNAYIFKTRDAQDMEKSIYQNDWDFYEKVEDCAFEYLYDRGYIVNTPKGYGFAKRSTSRNIRTEDKYVKRREKFGLNRRR